MGMITAMGKAWIEKHKKRIMVFFLAAAGGALLLLVIVRSCTENRQPKKPPPVPEEPAVLEWSRTTAHVNVGETLDLWWIYNKAGQPVVRCEGTAVAIVTMMPNGVKVKAMAPGVDIVTVTVGNLESVCIVTVADDVFRFTYTDEEGDLITPEVLEIPLEEIRNLDVWVEPETLLADNPVTYRLVNEALVEVIDSDSKYIVMRGKTAGETLLIAEWRGKRTEITIRVIDMIPRNIIIPYRKMYLNVGQETKLVVGLQDGETEDMLTFRFGREPGKENISVEANYNLATVKGLRAGEQYVRVSHPKAQVSRIVAFDVLPPAPPPAPVIEVSQAPVLLTKDEIKSVVLTVLNGSTADNAKFSYRIVENEYAIEVVQHGNVLNVKGIKPGAAKIVISNQSVRHSYELMAIVDSYVFEE